RSPCARWPSQTTYCTGIGWSRPICSRIAASALGSRSSPAKTRAGSPGETRTRTKTPIVTRNATGIMSTRRRRMYLITPSPQLTLTLLLQLRRLETRDPVRVGLHAGEILDADQRRHAEAEPNARRIVDRVDLLRLQKNRLAFRRIRLGALLLHERVDLRVGI